MEGIIEQVAVISICEVTLDDGVYNELSDHYEATNDSYHRYYPDKNWTYIKEPIKDKLNKALQEAGLVFPEVMWREPGHPDGYFNYYVLLHFNW